MATSFAFVTINYNGSYFPCTDLRQADYRPQRMGVLNRLCNPGQSPVGFSNALRHNHNIVHCGFRHLLSRLGLLNFDTAASLRQLQLYQCDKVRLFGPGTRLHLNSTLLALRYEVHRIWS